MICEVKFYRKSLLNNTYEFIRTIKTTREAIYNSYPCHVPDTYKYECFIDNTLIKIIYTINNCLFD